MSIQSANRSKIVASPDAPEQASVGGYVIGFVISLYISVLAYEVVTRHIWHTGILLTIITVLAIAQFFVQAFYFLHLRAESRPRWKLVVSIVMAVVVLILVLGSVWIMNNLKYNSMSPDQLKAYLQTNEGL